MEKIYCSNCGQLVDTTSNFCAFCGAPQHGKQAQFLAKAPVVEDFSTPKPKPTKMTMAKTKNVKRTRLGPIAIVSFFIDYVIKTWMIAVLALVGVYFQPQLFIPATLIYVVVMYLIAMIVHNNFFYSIDSKCFYEQYGILFKKHVSIPFEQVQNINITRDISDQILGLASLHIETAGSELGGKQNIAGNKKSEAEGILPALPLKRAIELHDLLVTKVSLADTN